LRQNNAEMAMQIEHLVTETHELKHKLKVSKSQGKFALAKIMKKCPVGMHRSAPAPMPNHQELKMPWSLTHTATRHKQKRGSWQPLDTIRGLFDNLKSLTGGTGLTVEESPRSYASAGTVGQLHRDVVELFKELKQTHVRLGKSEEVKSRLQDHLQAMQEKVVAMEEEAAKEQQQLNAFATNEQSLDQQLDDIKRNPSADDARGKIQSSAEGEAERESKVKIEAEKLHEEAERRLQEYSQEINKLLAENEKLQGAIEASKAQQQTEQTKLVNMQNSIQEGNGTAAKLQEESLKLKEAEATTRKREVEEDNELMASASQDQRCVDWTTKLEAKLKHVLQSKKDDATLCHSSILGLHKERVSLKDGNAKMHAEIKKLKRHAQDMQRQGDETLATLNSCLGL